MDLWIPRHEFFHSPKHSRAISSVDSRIDLGRRFWEHTEEYLANPQNARVYSRSSRQLGLHESKSGQADDHLVDQDTQRPPIHDGRSPTCVDDLEAMYSTGLANSNAAFHGGRKVCDEPSVPMNELVLKSTYKTTRQSRASETNHSYNREPLI